MSDVAKAEIGHPGLALMRPASPSLRSRRAGWELRLADVIEFARSRPYALGQHDCFRFACAAVEALTGVELWEAWQGTYRTKRRALMLLAAYGGGFTESFTKLFRVEPCAVALAHRGDILEFREYRPELGMHEPHLCVLAGAMAAGLGEQGLYFIGRERCVHAWRIG